MTRNEAAPGSRPEDGGQPGDGESGGSRKWGNSPRLLIRVGAMVIFAGVAVNVGIALWSIRGGAARVIESVAPGWLAVAVLLGLVPAFTHAARMRVWGGFLGAPTTFGGALRASFGNELGSAVSPKAIGGVPVKVAMLVETGMSAGTAASITLLNSLEDIFFFVVMAPAIAFLTARWQVPEVQRALERVQEETVAAAPWAAAIAVVGVLAWLWWRRGHPGKPGSRHPGTLARIRHDFATAYVLVGQRGKTRVLLNLALTGVHWICRCSVATAIMFGIGSPVDPVLFFLLQWVVYASMILIPTPGAAIGAEAAFGTIMDGFVPEGVLGLVTVGWRFATFYLVLLESMVAVPLLRARPRTPP